MSRVLRLTAEQRRLAEAHFPLAHRVTAEMLRRNSQMEHDDVLSDALLGLTEAACRFNPALNVPFGAYAGQVMQGRIVDGLRRRDVLSRHDRRLASEIDRARQRFTTREHRFPTDRELAAEAKMTPQKLAERRARIVRASQPVELDRPVGRAQLSLGEAIADERANPDEASDTVHRSETIDRMMLRLPERERFVLAMLFWEGMTLLEIGDVLGVTESRVCQIKQQALSQLRSMPDAVELAAA